VSEAYEYVVDVARVEASGALEVDWSAGPAAQVDFGNFHRPALRGNEPCLMIS
jgi:hypothetical protein